MSAGSWDTLWPSGRLHMQSLVKAKAPFTWMTLTVEETKRCSPSVGQMNGVPITATIMRMLEWCVVVSVTLATYHLQQY